MAIYEQISNSTPMTLAFMASRLSTTVAPSISADPSIDFCLCEFECDYQELAFAMPSLPNDAYKNDYSSLLYTVLDSADTAVMKLYKDDVLVATITDNTYGTFYDIGDIASQPLYVGFVVEWLKVYNAFGAGKYQIITTFSLLGSPLERKSRFFKVMMFDEKAANGTVRIETVQNGKVKRSAIDYTGLNWPQSIRIYGKFGYKSPQYNSEDVQLSDYTLQQVQDGIVNNYKLITSLLSSQASNQMIYDDFLANSILISDYNVFNNEIYRRVPVRPVEFGEPVYFGKNTKARFEFTFRDEKDDLIKRNY